VTKICYEDLEILQSQPTNLCECIYLVATSFGHKLRPTSVHSNTRKWIYIYTYLLTPLSRVLDKLIGFQLVKKFPAFYGKRRFITSFASARHLSLSWASLIKSIPSHPTSWRSILILSSTPGSSKWSLSRRLPHQSPVYDSSHPHTRYMPRPSHFRFLVAFQLWISSVSTWIRVRLGFRLMSSYHDCSCSHYKN
jgi:hypothetical protein